MADFANLRARLERAGLSASSSDWLMKALSPATPTGAGCLIPDTSNTPVAVPEYVISQTFSAPSSAGTGNWDCLVITPPSYPLLAYVVTAVAGFDFTQPWAGGSSTVNIMQTESAVAGATATMQITMLTAGASTNTFTNTIPSTCLQPSTQPLKWRTTARSSTQYLVASDLSNQGTVTSGQYPTRIQSYRPWLVFGTATTAANSNYSYSMRTMEIPLNENDMTSMNPRVRVAPAKQGVYQPCYNEGPTWPWAQGADMSGIGIANGFASGGGNQGRLFLPVDFAGGTTYNSQQASCMPELLIAVDTTNDHAIDDWVGGFMTIPTVAANPYTWGHTTEMVGVSIYRGLANAASLTVKMVLAVEIAPAPTSPVRQFVMDAPGNDPRALQLYFDLVRDMPHSYPSSANFLGAVLAAVSSLLPTVLPHIPAVISGIRSFFSPPETRGSAQPELRDSSRSAITAPAAPAPMVVARVKPRKKKVRVLARRSSSVGSKASRASRARSVKRR